MPYCFRFIQSGVMVFGAVCTIQYVAIVKLIVFTTMEIVRHRQKECQRRPWWDDVKEDMTGFDHNCEVTEVWDK